MDTLIGGGYRKTGSGAVFMFSAVRMLTARASDNTWGDWRDRGARPTVLAATTDAEPPATTALGEFYPDLGYLDDEAP